MLVHAQQLRKLLEVLLREVVEVLLYDCRHQLLHSVVGSAFYLQQQTLLQRVRTDASRVEGLQDSDYAVDVLNVAVDALIDSQFVAYRLAVLAQQSVAVERPDDVFHYLLVVLREVYLAHLLLQLVVERARVAVYHLLVVGRIGSVGSGVSRRRHVFVGTGHTVERIVQRRLAFLPLCVSGEGVRLGVHLVHVAAVAFAVAAVVV